MGRINTTSWEQRLTSLAEDLELTEFQLDLIMDLVDAILKERQPQEQS